MKKSENKKNEETESQENIQEKTELELLTEQMIEETIQVLEKQFISQIRMNSSDKKPIGKEKVRSIMNHLIGTAVARRLLLPSRIEKSVETGMLFERYYSRLQVINNLTNVTHTKMRRMQDAERDYRYQNAVYAKVLERAYENDAVPRSEEVDHEEQADLWRVINKAGGLDDE